MPRKKQWPPKLSEHKASGQARARWEGSDHYFGPWGEPATEEAYRRWVAKTEAAGGSAAPPSPKEPDRVTVAAVAVAYLDQEAGRYDPEGGEARQVKTACKVLCRLFGSEDAAAFDASKLEDVRSAMLSGSWRTDEERAALKKEGRAVDWCARHSNAGVNRIRRVWRWAERKKLTQPGSWAALRALPPVGKGDRRYRQSTPRQPVEFDTIRRLARECPHPAGTMLLLQWWTGARSQEVRLLRPCDLDRKGEVWTYTPHKHKCSWRGQSRVIPLGRKSQALLRPLLEKAKDPAAYLFRPPRNGSVVYNASTYAQAVRNAADRLGLKGVPPYLCRHSAKRRITRELGLDAARAVLGQKSLGTTNDYAAGIDEEVAKEAAKRLG